MNTYALHVVIGIRADSCLLFHVAPPLALGTCPLHAAHPPAVSPEPDLLSRVLCRANESLR
jgi:hypothetical protein